jgi:hypothetical protein
MAERELYRKSLLSSLFFSVQLCSTDISLKLSAVASLEILPNPSFIIISNSYHLCGVGTREAPGSRLGFKSEHFALIHVCVHSTFTKCAGMICWNRIWPFAIARIIVVIESTFKQGYFYITFQIGIDWCCYLRKVSRKRRICHTHPMWLWGLRHLGQFFMEPSDYYGAPIDKVLHFIRDVGLILTYLRTEMSPSWEAANCAAIQEIPSNFKEPKGSLPCSQEPSTGPYPEPVGSSPHHPILSL